MKRFLLFCISAALLLSLCLDAAAEAAPSAAMTCGEWTFTLLADGTAMITGFEGNARNLEVPGQMDSYPVTAIAEGAFSRRSCRQIILPAGVEIIEKNAFTDCLGLSELYLPGSVRQIPGNPFLNCPRLTAVHLPDDLSCALCIMNGALIDRQEMRLICVVTADSNEYAVPKGIQVIGEDAFRGMQSLAAVSLPDTLQRIDSRAFDQCGLRSVDLPAGLAEIGNFAFAGCPFSSVELPDSLSAIGTNPFLGCDQLTEIRVSSANPALICKGGMLISVRDRRLVSGLCPRDSFIVPSDVEIIGDYAFSYGSLKSVDVSEGIRRVGEGAFYACGRLRDVSLPDSVDFLGGKAFQGCYSLVDIRIPEGLTAIGDDTFASSSLYTVVIPDGVTRIGDRAFADCSRLMLAAFPRQLRSIGEEAFAFTHLRIAVLPAHVERIGDRAFAIEGLERIFLPPALTEIGEDILDFGALDPEAAVFMTDRRPVACAVMDSPAYAYCAENGYICDTYYAAAYYSGMAE